MKCEPEPPPKSHADERLQQTANHAIQFEIALHRDQTDAILRRVRPRSRDRQCRHRDRNRPARNVRRHGQSYPKARRSFRSRCGCARSFWCPTAISEEKPASRSPRAIEWDANAPSARSISMNRPGNRARSAVDRARRLVRRHLAPALPRQKEQPHPIAPRH